MTTHRMAPGTFTALLAALLCLAAFVPAATAADNTSAADIKRETAELLQALKNYGVEQRDEALAKSRAALDNLDRRIEALEARMLEQWDDMDQAAREQARASQQALREQRRQVAEWYGSMRSGSASAWGHVKQGFSEAYQALQDAWEKSEQEFGSSDKN